MATTTAHDTSFGTAGKTHGKLANVLTWTVQGLLSALFLFAGAMKFIMPAEEMTKNSPLPLAFLYFIGVCEFLGCLGLVLPGALTIKRGLTPVAAIGLTIIMAGATVISFKMGPAAALFPFVAGALAAIVAYRRWRWLSE